MNYRVHELALAQADIRSIFDWLSERSATGAEAWLDAYDLMKWHLCSHEVATAGSPMRQHGVAGR